MKKLWVFGDSYSAPFSEIGINAKNYEILKGYQPKVYCDFISEKLGICGYNFAKGGLDNYSILNMLCDKVDDIKDDDIIIIGWSSPTRFRIAIQQSGLKDKWVSLVPGHIDEWVNDYSNVFINRGYSNLYWQEVISWSKLINKKFKNQIIHFSPFAFDDSPVPKNWIIDGIKIETIKKETNGKISDRHYSENGHEYLADLFVAKIKNNKTETDKKNLI